MQTATKPPSTVVAEMTAVPEPTATTKPLLDTVQIELFELAQFTFLSLALSGPL